MRTVLLLLILHLCRCATAQVTDTVLRYSEQLPASGDGIKKQWKQEKLYFLEFAEGTGAGVFKKPDQQWATHEQFRNVSVRLLGKDSLLLKFRTAVNWDEKALRLGHCNANPNGGTIKHIAKKAGPFFDPPEPENGPAWHWEVLIAWPWDVAFQDRIKPFGFFITFERK
jgi:hypothetical protein